jgi:RNA polymerase sigma factor (sigma-70 family)
MVGNAQGSTTSEPPSKPRGVRRASRTPMVIAGRRRAEFEAFCEVVGPRLRRALLAQVGDAAAAEELAQEALISVASRWRAVQAMDRPDLYAQRVASNLAVSAWRRRDAERRAVERLHRGGPVTWDDPDSAASVALRRAVAALPSRQRQAVALRFLADLPVSDVAAVMGCAEGTVKALTHRAMPTLRAALTDPEDLTPHTALQGDVDG